MADFKSYSMDNRTYRFFKGEPAYPFGFGLSYTIFSYSNLSLEQVECGIKVSATVENIGEKDGDEVVQVYKHQEAEFRTPLRSLVAVKRIHLKAGQTQAVDFVVDEDRLALFDENGSQVMLSGKITFSVGGSQNDSRSVELMGYKPLTGEIRYQPIG